MKVIFMGTPEFSKTVLSYLIKEKYNIRLVVSKKDMPMGRKRILTPQPLKVYALENNLNVLTPNKLSEIYPEIDKINPDIIITAAYGLMVPDYLLNKYHVINVHASLLPKYRGGAPIEHAMMNLEKETGISIMKLVTKMDAGPVYVKESLKIDYNETKTILTDKLAHLGGKLLLKYLKNINSYKAIPQDEEKVTYAYNIKLEDQLIDFNETVDKVLAKIKAMQDEPGAFFTHKGIIVKIINARKCDIIKEISPNTIKVLRNQLLLGAKDGFVEVLQIQESGKKPMDIKSYLNGQKLFVDGEKITK